MRFHQQFHLLSERRGYEMWTVSCLAGIVPSVSQFCPEAIEFIMGVTAGLQLNCILCEFVKTMRAV